MNSPLTIPVKNTLSHIVVVGNGMVGQHLVEQLVQKNAHLEHRITVIGAERFIAYDRVQLSSLFAGKSHDDLMLSNQEWYDMHGIQLVLGSQVTGIDREQKRILLDGEDVLGYDQLVLATGSYPFVPPIEGKDRDNVFVYRTLDDLSQIKKACEGARTGAVIGGGLLGLEAANALKLLGLETHVIEFAPRLMPVQLDDGAGLVLKEKIEALGLTVHTSTGTERICDGETAKHRMVFKDKDPLEVDVIVFSAGIRPQDELARIAELEVGERGGIVINNQCQTSDENIYAIGECALWEQKIFGLVAPGYTMARTTADVLTGMLDGEMPDSAIICSCHNVTKGDLVAEIQAGTTNLTDLKANTKAGTGCGGCSNMVKSVLDTQLAAMGVEVNNHLCEHFELSRQEMFHICQVEQIKDFDTLITLHGKGHGCDICKPTAASVFASLWNEHIMEPQHQSLQDSNDAFMANLQKDGSYSIVPRVPGGEITPDKLIVLGEVAQQYDLYTKITGGQRVDLFGAQLEQLPEIWQTLIDAGFETGHAYGKSVRTVKSCVGSTWCRYGVDDSVGLAIELENRYKGLRAPHKLKFAVSGCTRECAEAQSKDIGVIATENGWNLYVCGNGGMRPRHADLFASDLSKSELITMIDRVLMFYVSTADRLQRTSVWMENMEGGLDYLKQVILDDSLNLCDSLDEQMARVVDTYQCDWKSTLDNPQKLQRFRPFLNSTSGSKALPYQRVRGQRIPVKQEV
ncbi:FAD-dependent oxidoreductase [Vibrio parahaemolyticus]|uniref:FAD-dependent oxidoreductase n=1 Tax=Vibrio parahaemolyticus TaxID=670 RepID=UPI0006A71E0E|nr:FAD-dependent oxidoreductase [Vibrio parahaemolyticus]EHK9097585.1 FAD-dependent oxidoreductase [Vibrio parahaemolyticus]EJE8564263.1 FAD-dependent oxidoreductase [Vibrio parahaemolyticus]KON54907.1 nitrite reductase [Vibrio parahaemolyticus]